MTLLDLGIIFLIIIGLIFFFVFWYACLLWTNRNRKEKKNILGAGVVSLIQTFKIFFFGALIIIFLYLCSIIFYYPL